MAVFLGYKKYKLVILFCVCVYARVCVCEKHQFAAYRKKYHINIFKPFADVVLFIVSRHFNMIFFF